MGILGGLAPYESYKAISQDHEMELVKLRHEAMLEVQKQGMQAQSFASAPMMQFHTGSLSLMPPQERPKCSGCGREDRERHDDFCPRDKRSVMAILQGWINKWLSDAIIT